MIYDAEYVSNELWKDKAAKDLTFSCCMFFNSLSSRYVRLLKTGVLKGFMIFLIATEEPVSWSFAELDAYGSWLRDGEGGRTVPDETESPLEQADEQRTR